jgi:outer membrane protein assembly factor BamD (BamD/ComL family)
MDNPDKTLPEQQPPELTETELLRETMKEQWRRWGMQIGLAAAIVIALFLYRAYKQNQEDQASRMLGEARNAQALQAIMAQYPGTPAARLALLQTAKAQFDAGDFASAAASYAQFATKYPKHTMIGMAELGKIECWEAMGQTDEALAAYSAFVTANPGSFLMPLAQFGKARCLEQLKRYGEAKAIYEDFLVAHPESQWKTDVEENLSQLDRVTRKSDTTP